MPARRYNEAAAPFPPYCARYGGSTLSITVPQSLLVATDEVIE
jgi:hypothetical protein